MTAERLPNGCHLYVTPDCTFGTDALLLSQFVRVKPRQRLCDLGTGCGIVPLLLQSRHPTVLIDGVDCCREAVALARRSVEENGLSDRITIHEQSWVDLTLPPDVYDIVTCNPPYFAQNSGKVSEDPLRRLARHEQEQTLEEVTAAAARLLKCGGRFVLCHRPERLTDLLATLRAHRLEPKRLQTVSAAPDRAPFLVLCEAVKNGGVSLSVLPPLFLERRESP